MVFILNLINKFNTHIQKGQVQSGLIQKRESIMKRIEKGFIRPSAAITIKRKEIKYYKKYDKPPEPGDIAYGMIIRIGEHSSLENVSGRIHKIYVGTKTIFVFGNRYAPDYYEGLVPSQITDEVDLLSRSGIIGEVKTKNLMRKDPTRVQILGYVCNKDDGILNTRYFYSIKPRSEIKKEPRSPMIIICGTSMNSGKSFAAAACCRALSSLGYTVRASKVTGTAGLKDILHMNDAGANTYADFTYFGYPSTYLLSEEDLLNIFNKLDLKYANNPQNFWVVEFADGVIQRETAILLRSPDVTNRVHKFIFCANDTFGAIGGLRVLSDRSGIKPDAISGLCSSSPLYLRELADFVDIPTFNSADSDLHHLQKILLLPKKQISNMIQNAA